VIKAWSDHDQDLEKTAQALGITTKTLAAKLKDLNIQ
jgi:hypothetical protein